MAVVFAALQVSSMTASAIFRGLEENPDLSRTEFVSKLQMLDRMEVYDDSTYQANAMVNALQLDNTTGRGIANRYARTLLASEEFNNCYYVAAYYYLPCGTLTASLPPAGRVWSRRRPTPAPGTVSPTFMPRRAPSWSPRRWRRIWIA